MISLTKLKTKPTSRANAEFVTTKNFAEDAAQQHCSTPETFQVQIQDAAIYPQHFETNHHPQATPNSLPAKLT